MTQALLTTKLYFPQARTRLVSRPRLNEKLDQGLQKSLTLISAPAGYGKTTLLCDWRLSLEREYPFVWLSLDPEDNNLGRFFNYLSVALETLDPQLTRDLITQLHSPQLPPVEELITVLINAVSVYSHDFALVLDDYHVITNSSIHTALIYLLEHAPRNFHLVLLTRSDPPFPLARMRARGQMVELRTVDLRFNPEETASFLNYVMELHLSITQVDALDQRTEGWVVGLQMAALSIQGKADANAFINAFTGSNRHILDFLTEEVIKQQSEPIQTFLLQTSILDRLSGPLCDAVLAGSMESAQILVDLERKNLFLIPLDEERLWYRYHHLFAEMLYQYLKRTQPQIVNELYGRAATWLEANGYLEDAIGYALKAHKYEDATRLMDQIRNILLGRGDIRLMFTWLNFLPENMVQNDPELCLSFTSCLTISGYFELAEKWANLAEAGFTPLIATDQHAALRMLVIPLYRSAFARFQGNFARAIALCQDTLVRIPKNEIRYIGVALMFLGHAHFYAGNTMAADQALSEAIPTCLASGHYDAYSNAIHHLAKLRVLQSRLHDACITYEQASVHLKEKGVVIYSGTENSGLGDLYREWNQLEAASVEIQKGIELAEAGDHIFYLIDVYLARVRLALAQKNWEAAWSYLNKAEQVYRRCPTTIEIAYLHAWQARLNLAKGDLLNALTWADNIETHISSSITPQREFELLTLARIRIAQGKVEQAAPLLESIRIGAENAGRYGRALDARMLKALAEQAQGQEKQSVEELAQVLSLAEPEGYARMFLDEGQPMVKLLYKVSTQSAQGVRDYAARLLASLQQETSEQPASQVITSKGTALVEPLSKRELEVLRLMADGCANKEIASRLVISLGTVKRHIVHILQKLDAANRTQAVAIARELEII